MISEIQERLKRLDEEMEQKTLKGLAGGSYKNFRVHVNAYVQFCILFGLAVFDSGVLQFRRFTTHLQRTHKSVESVKQYVSGAKKLFLLFKMPPPDISDYMYSLTLKGILREKGHIIKRASPVNPHLLASMFEFVDVNDITQMVTWVALLLGFYMFFRKSNLVPDTVGSFDYNKQLCRKNIYWWGDMYIVQVFWAKNVQFHEKELIIPLLCNPDKRICPVYWLTYMLDNIPGGPLDPALMVARKQGWGPLTYGQLTYWLRKWVKMAGLQEAMFSSHSLRRGGASWAAECGLPSHVIKMLGDWRSQSFLDYIDMTLQSKVSAMQIFTISMSAF